MSAEIHAHCPACDRVTLHYAESGDPICSHCGLRPERLDAYEADDPLDCPGCGRKSLGEIARGLWACRPCGWQGADPHAAGGHQEILECLAEDARRGKKGGGSSSKRMRDDKLRFVRREPLVDDSVAKRLADQTKPLRVKGLDATSEEIREALGEMMGGEVTISGIDTADCQAIE